MSMLGWWMVHTTVLPVLTVFLTARITMAAARASSPLVGLQGGGQGQYTFSSSNRASLGYCDGIADRHTVEVTNIGPLAHPGDDAGAGHQLPSEM